MSLGARIGRYIIASTTAKFNEVSPRAVVLFEKLSSPLARPLDWLLTFASCPMVCLVCVFYPMPQPENLFSVPCDLCFPCASHNEIDATTATMLADMGCQGTYLKTLLIVRSCLSHGFPSLMMWSGVFEGSHMPSNNDAIKVYKKRGLMHGGYIGSLAVDSLFNGVELARHPLEPNSLDDRIKTAIEQLYDEAKATAKEFNVRGDVHSGAIIAAFLRVADVMVAHGKSESDRYLSYPPLAFYVLVAVPASSPICTSITGLDLNLLTFTLTCTYSPFLYSAGAV